MTRIATIIAGLLAAPTLAWPQAFPNKPIRFLVPYSAGGGTDIVARAVGAKMQESMGQPVLVENRPGGNEVIATEMLARAAPDGHTIAIVASTFVINPSLLTKLPYDSERDFAPVTKLVDVPFALFAHPSLQANTLKELAALAKVQPAKLNYAHLGNTSPHFLAMEAFKKSAGVDIAAIPYKGVAPAFTAIAGGEVQMIFAGVSAGMPQVQGGKLKALAVAADKRMSVAPEVPTVKESGYPEFDVRVWYGVLAPGATRPDLLVRLNTEMTKALGAEDIKQRFAAVGMESAPMTSDAYANLIRNEMQAWSRLVKSIGVKAE
jgi:tripartite-type tricarboxylate transporter receptor subunit TctC